MKKMLIVLFCTFFFSFTSHIEAQNARNLLGFEITALSGGPGLGIRGWLGNFGYGASGGVDWDFEDVNGSLRIMYSFLPTMNKFFILAKMGYYEFSEEQQLFGQTLSSSGALFSVGLGVGYEWFLTSKSAISIDGGYNFINEADYEISYGSYSQKYKFSMPIWIGGSYTIYF